MDLQEIKVTRDFDQWRKNAGVLIASWGRFKGLEADAIVIIETPDDDHQSHRYVARSRAKHLLTIINAEQI
jgi:DNA helicase IV